MAVIKKSENVMELNNTVASAAGFLVSFLFIIGGFYYGIIAITHGGDSGVRGGESGYLVLPLLLIPFGFGFLINVRKVVIILDKSSGKASYDMLSIRGSEHLEFPISDIARITLKMRSSVNHRGASRSVAFNLNLKDGKILSYSSPYITSPPKEVEVADFLGIPQDEAPDTD